jgi:hypothetical protein
MRRGLMADKEMTKDADPGKVEAAPTAFVAPATDPRIDALTRELEDVKAVAGKALAESAELRSELKRGMAPEDSTAEELTRRYGLSGKYLELGPENIVANRHVTRTEIAEAGQRIEASLRKELADSTDRTLKAVFYSNLDTACPQWEGIRQSPQFAAWSRANGRDMELESAKRANNAVAAGRVFNDFLREYTREPAPVLPEREVAKFEVPGGAASHLLPRDGARPPGPEKPKTYTTSEIHAFSTRYADPATRHPGDNDLYVEYQKACREGRVVPG